MYQIHELAAKAGITVRTLHHYDRIGLLHPSRHSPAGYRLYDDSAALRLQQILFYRELGLPLADIGRILDAPGFDLMKALGSHREKLDKRIARLQRLRLTVDNTLAYVKGENSQEMEELWRRRAEAHPRRGQGCVSRHDRRHAQRRRFTGSPGHRRALALEYVAFLEAQPRSVGPSGRKLQRRGLRPRFRGPNRRAAQSGISKTPSRTWRGP